MQIFIRDINDHDFYSICIDRGAQIRNGIPLPFVDFSMVYFPALTVMNYIGM